MAGIADDVEQKLRDRQKNKQFKDAGDRVAGSRKEKAAFKQAVTSRDLPTLEHSPATAALLVVKDKVFPPVDVAQQRLDGAAAGMVYLKTQLRQAFPPHPAKQYYTAEGRAAYVRLYEWVLDVLDRAGVDPSRVPALVAQALKTPEFLDIAWPRDVLIGHYNELVRGQLRFGPATSTVGLTLLDTTTELPGQAMNEAFRQRHYHSFNLSRWLDTAYGVRLWNLLRKQGTVPYRVYREAQYYNGEDPAIATANWTRSVASRTKDVEVLQERVRAFDAQQDLTQAQYFISVYHQEITADLGFQVRDAELSAHQQAVVIAWLRQRARHDLTEAQLRLHQEQVRGANPRPADWSWAEKKKKAAPRGKETADPDADAPAPDPNALDAELQNLRLNDNRPLAYIKRTGGLRIEQVSETEIIRLFGFKAVELGNYVRDVEAAEHLRHFLGAMADLYEILDLDAVQVTQLGNLSIAFGSRGQGGKAAAFYDPNYHIINLTKKTGDGTVAHEWLHYLDHVLYQQLAAFNEPRTPFFSAGYPAGRGQNYPALKTDDFGVRTAYNALFAFIRTSAYLDPATGRTSTLNPKGVTLTLRFYRQKARVPRDRGAGSPFDPVNFPTPELAIKEVQLQYEYLENVDRKPKLFQRDAPWIYGYLAHAHNVPYLDVRVRTGATTAFFYASSAMKSGYWIEPWELLARSFERYVSDKLTAAGRANNYLVAAENKFVGARGQLYPQGEEARVLAGLYDTLFAELKKALKLRPFVPFTSQRTDEYLVLDAKTATETVTAGVVAPAAPPETAVVATPPVLDVATRLRLAQAKAKALALRRRRETPPA